MWQLRCIATWTWQSLFSALMNQRINFNKIAQCAAETKYWRFNIFYWTEYFGNGWTFIGVLANLCCVCARNCYLFGLDEALTTPLDSAAVISYKATIIKKRIFLINGCFCLCMPIFTAHAQVLLFLSFRSKFWQILTDYKQRHISTSGWAQNAAKRAQLESMGKLYTTIAPELLFIVSFLPYSVESPGRGNRSV